MMRSQKELNRLALQLHFAAIARAPKKPDDVIGSVLLNLACVAVVTVAAWWLLS